MGKKVKTGKGRKDKFYHLAKETGYRARSAFKLIQLNRKFNFLQSSRCLIDLCAAPGGWLQVASNFMPVSSLIIGVDLVPIKPIKNVLTFQDDITSESCKQRLKKELQTWKADCVLNDGAPNVGAAWVQDAFSQAELTLSALKLATENLRDGGWFITKVFRSKDYQPLLWVFQQLFKKVHSTKPQASRNESAEIFVVCEGYIAPHKIDPKLLDPRHVFKEVQEEKSKKASILQPEKKKRAEGYKEGDTLFNTIRVSEFIQSTTPLQLLTDINEIVFDDKNILNHNLTTDEIKICCKDIKVLGRPDIKNLLSWQKLLRKEMYPKNNESKSAADDEEEENEEEAIEKTILSLQEEENAEIRRKKRKATQQRQKLREKMELKMVLPGDTKEIEDDAEIFSLANIRTKKHLEEIDDIGANVMDDGALGQEDSEDEEIELDEETDDGDDDDDDDDDDESKSEDSENEKEKEEDEDEGNEEEMKEIKSTASSAKEEKNPLVVDLEPDVPATLKADMWFKKDAFKGLEDEQDEDMEITQMLEDYKKKGGKLLADADCSNNNKKSETNEVPNKKIKLDNKPKDDDDDDNDDDDTSEDSDSSDSDSNYDVGKTNEQNDKKDKDFEIVPQESSNSYAKKLTPEGLALGAQMAFSRKRKRDIIDDSYSRWSFNDTDLPSWFVEDEAKYHQRTLPVTKEQVREYAARMKEINARPIKKIAEAKGRKKRKEMRRMERARKKAETICEASDVPPQEKLRQIQNLYKKASVGKKKKEISYVVTKKHQAAKRMRRPAGVKGPFKVVDPRLKKDMRAKKLIDKKKNKKSGRGKR